MTVVFYTRPNCPMCLEARETLVSARQEFDEVEVTDDPALEAEYGQFVPVVELDGRIVFHAGMTSEDLLAALAQEQT